MVNTPPHYTTGPVECIDLIEGLDFGYHLGNVVKYLYRHKSKGGTEDLKKARWYLDREISRRGGLVGGTGTNAQIKKLD